MDVAKLAVFTFAVGCGVAGDGMGRVRLPPPLSQCSVAIDDTLGPQLPTAKHGGPLTPGDVMGMVCDVVRW